MCPDVLLLFSIKHQGIFLLEVKNMNKKKWYDDPKFFKFICYDRDIYNKYVSLFDRNKKFINNNKKSNRTINAWAKRINNFLNQQDILAVFERSVKHINIMSQQVNSWGTIKPKITTEEIINFIDQSQDGEIVDYENLKNRIDSALDSIEKENVSIEEAFNSVFSGYLGDITENLITEISSEKINIINSKCEAISVGALTYGQDNEVLNSVMNSNNNYKVMDWGNLKQELKWTSSGGKIVTYNGKQMKIDSLLKIQNQKNAFDLTIGVKSHWGKNKQSKIQATEKSLRHVFSLALMYNMSIKRNDGYWKFLNDIFYINEKNDDLIELVYGAFFGNVDYMIDWQLNNNEPEVLVVTREKLINYLKNNQKISLIRHSVSITEQNYLDSDIPINESDILDGIIIRKMNITLSAV